VAQEEEASLLFAEVESGGGE
jgi:hypothetical protein